MKPELQRSIWILLVCIAGFAAQCILTFTLFERLTFEELAESIRNPYWIANRDLYDGISSNVVYYKVLDIYYQLTGFHLFAAKQFRLLLSFASISVLGLFLYRCKRYSFSGAITLLAFLLSPTLLYFNTHQASFGIDLQVFPIIGIIWLYSLGTRGVLSLGLLFIVAFMVILLAAMFPPGLFFLPALIVVDLLVSSQKFTDSVKMLKQLLLRSGVFVAGLLAGLLLPFLLVDEPGSLFFDPHTQAGLFRGGGKLSLHPIAFVDSLWRTMQDLFVIGDSYQFYLPHPEFGTALAVISMAAMVSVLLVTVWKLRPFSRGKILYLARRANTQIAAFAGVLILTFLIVGHLSPNLPGLRRSAGLLIGFYLLFFLILQISQKRHYFPNQATRWVALLALCLLPISHLLQLSGNLSDLTEFNRKDYPKWLRTEPSASESLAAIYSEVQDGRSLRCDEVPPGCRYSVPFAALQLRHRSISPEGEDLQVFAEDPKTGLIVLVERALWEDYYWLH